MEITSQMQIQETPVHDEVVSFTGFDGTHLGSISSQTTASGLTVYQHLGPDGQLLGHAFDSAEDSLSEETIELTHAVATHQIQQNSTEETASPDSSSSSTYQYLGSTAQMVDPLFEDLVESMALMNSTVVAPLPINQSSSSDSSYESTDSSSESSSMEEEITESSMVITPEEIESHRSFLEERRTHLQSKLQDVRADLKSGVKGERKLLMKLNKKDRKFQRSCIRLMNKGKPALSSSFFALTNMNKYAVAMPGNSSYHKDVIVKQNKLHCLYHKYATAFRNVDSLKEKKQRAKDKLSLIPKSSKLMSDSVVRADLIKRRHQIENMFVEADKIFSDLDSISK
jgi:hypothetical protein